MVDVQTHWFLIFLAIVALAAIAADPKAVAQGVANILLLIGSWPAEITQKVKEWCQSALRGLLLFESGSVETDEKQETRSAAWLVHHCIGLLVHVLVAGSVGLGALSLEWLRGALVGFGLAAGESPIPPWLAIGLLLVGVPALWGSLLWEGIGWMPEPYRLIPRARTGVKGGLFWFALLGFTLSIFVGTIVWMDSTVILHLGTWPLLDQLFSIGMGPLVGVTLAICLGVIVLGVPAVLAIPVGAIWLAAELVHVLSSMVQKLLDALAEHVVPHVVRVLALPGQFVGSLLHHIWMILQRAPVVGGLVREPSNEDASQKDDWEKLRRQLQPEPGVAEERPLIATKAVSLEPKTSLVVVDEVGNRSASPFLRSLGDLGSKNDLEITAWLSPSRRPSLEVATQAHRLGARQVSLDSKDISHASSLASSPNQFHDLCLERGVQKIIATMPRKGSEDVIFAFMEMRRFPGASKALRSLFFGLSQRQQLLPVLELPSISQLADEDILAGLANVQQLWQEGKILGAIIYDRTSPLAREVGQMRQQQLIGRTLAGVVVAHRHGLQNRSAVDELRVVTRSYPLVHLCVGSSALLPGQPLSPFDPGRWATRADPVGRGDFEHTRAKDEELLHRVATDPGCSTVAIQQPLSSRSRLFVCISPFGPKDPRFQQLAEGIDVYLGSGEGPSGRAIYVGGNGTSDGSVGTRYFTQVAMVEGMDVSELSSLPSEETAQKRGTRARASDLLVPPRARVSVNRRRGQPQAV